MKHIIVGTAGHIDHGKTTLIRALTGRETDTLKEEKTRGISINLGFTFFDLPSGRRAGIIDVPGHEKFIKNMLAGVSSVDIVLLVIAADEGIMPQTREHFEILQLLNIKKGIIVLTKKDLVDKEWLSMINEDIREEFKDTFLKNSPIIPVSSRTGEGMEELIKEIDKATEEVEAKDTEGHFRLPVDRVFSVSGFGTVITGTIISGKLKEGDTVQVYPSMAIGKIRNIQVHDENVLVAEAGQRTALNISNLRAQDIERGDVISKEQLMESSMIIDAKVYHLKNAEKPIENRQRLRLYHGTSEILCRIVILDKETIEPGEEAYVQFRLEKTITAQRMDRFVIRAYSPMITIGGGAIIEPVASKAKRFDVKYIEDLKIKESGKIQDIIENTIDKISNQYPSTFEILKALGKNEEDIESKLSKLLEQNKIIKLGASDKEIYIHKNFYNKTIKAIKKLLEDYHKENPLKAGMSKEELKTKVFGKGLKQKNYDEILALLEKDEVVKGLSNYIALYDFKIQYNKEQKQAYDKLMKIYEESAYAPPRFEDLLLQEKDKRTFKMVYDSLLENDLLFKISEDIVLTKENFEKAKSLIINHINTTGQINAGDTRDLLNTSRKYVISILEYLDSIKITKRVEDKRVLY